MNPDQCRIKREYTHFFCKKLVLERPNREETFSTQATDVKKLIIFFSFSYHTFDKKKRLEKNLCVIQTLIVK